MPRRNPRRRWRALLPLSAGLLAGAIWCSELPVAQAGGERGPGLRSVTEQRDRLRAVVARESVGCAAGPLVARYGAIRSGRPLMVIVGASFTAGVGALGRQDGWAHLVADDLGWAAEVRGVPGAGYVHRARHGATVGSLLREAGLRRLQPAMVVLQAGHDDIGEPLRLVRERVTQDVHLVRQQAPGARLVLVTVFTHAHETALTAVATDNAIVSAALRADPHALVIDPLRRHWQFPRVHGGLHPDQAGHDWIAYRVAEDLAAHGAKPYVGRCPVLGFASGRGSRPAPI